MLQGQSVSSRLFDGLWAFDLQTHTWELLDGEGHPNSDVQTSPPSRSLHTIAIIDDNTLVVHGGVRKVRKAFHHRALCFVLM